MPFPLFLFNCSTRGLDEHTVAANSCFHLPCNSNPAACIEEMIFVYLSSDNVKTVNTNPVKDHVPTGN